jgi:hypothetical protein
MTTKKSTKLLRRLATHPFFRIDPELVRTRAYYHWLNKTGREWWDERSNWEQAELEEIINYAQAMFVTLRNGPGLVPAQPLDFENNYELLIHLKHSFTSLDKRPQMLGTPNPRLCSLCDRGEPAVSFKTDAHVIPEAFGNKSIFTLDECDECNHEYGRKLDNHLAAMFMVERALARLPPKGTRTAKAKLGEGRSSIGGQARGKPLHIELVADDNSVSIDHVSKNTLTIKVPAFSFRPISAIRAFARMAWQALPAKQRGHFGLIRRLVLNEIEILPASIHRIFMPGPGFSFVSLTVWTRTGSNAELPELITLFTFGNYLLIWSSPDFKSGIYRPTLLPPLLRSPYPPHLPTHDFQVFTSDEPFKSPKQPTLNVNYNQSYLGYTEKPIPVCIEVDTPTGLQSIDTELSTPIPVESMRPDYYTYEISGGHLAGQLKIEVTPTQKSLNFTDALAGRSPTEGLATLRAVKAALDGARLRIIERDTLDEILIIEGQGNSRAENFENAIELAEALALIEERLGISFPIPEQASVGDATALRSVVHLLTQGSIDLPITSTKIPMDPVTAREFIKQMSANESNEVQLHITESMQILGREIDLGPTAIMLKGARLTRSVAELGVMVATMKEGELLEVELTFEHATQVLLRSSSPTHK